MRLIDADEMILDLYRRCSNEIFYKQVKESLIDCAPTVNPYEWISVEDRLPEDKQECLIYATTYFIPDHVDDCNYYDSIEVSKFYKDFGFISNMDSRAKFWMPLPAPPTEKEN